VREVAVLAGWLQLSEGDGWWPFLARAMHLAAAVFWRDLRGGRREKQSNAKLVAPAGSNQPCCCKPR